MDRGTNLERRVEEFLNLSNFCRGLEEALSRECSPLPASLLLELFEKRATDNERRMCGKLLRADNGDVFVSPALVFIVYADWINDIGTALGFECQDDESAGQWIKDDMVAIRAITMEIQLTVLEYLGRCDDRLKAEFGYSAFDTLMQALNSGESMEQSRARLHAQHRGLKRIV